MTLDEYINSVLSSLNLPITRDRVNFLRAWAREENTKAQNNPFATTWNMEPYRTDKYIGGYYFNYNNNFPVKNYSTPELGVRAFVNTIKEPYYYPNIMKGLQSGAPFDQWSNTTAQEFAKYGGDPYYANKVVSIYNGQTKNLPVGGNTASAGMGFLLLLLAAGQVAKRYKLI